MEKDQPPPPKKKVDWVLSWADPHQLMGSGLKENSLNMETCIQFDTKEHWPISHCLLPFQNLPVIVIVCVCVCVCVCGWVGVCVCVTGGVGVVCVCLHLSMCGCMHA